MELIKRQTSNNSDDYCDNKRQKTQITTDERDSLSKEPVSCFEDLSNELIYDIFEFLDYFQTYEAFMNLSQRFQGLLMLSNLPIKINFSSISKSALKRYNKDIIEPNIDRISLLRLSDVFSYEVVFSSFCRLSEFTRLETLILHNIESEYLQILLDQLSSLSLLSSLTITTVDTIQHTNMIYHKIFRLPALKYCKLPVLRLYNNDLSPAVTSEYSSIEHLIINESVYLHQLNNLLSYVPYLRRLSCHLVEGIWKQRAETCSFSLNHLTHLSCEISSIEFGQLERVIRNFFPKVEVLHFTATYDRSRTLLNMNNWKQLIVSHMPNLRIFDVQLQTCVETNDDHLATEAEINQFTSPFWIERQWFFAHHFYETRLGEQCIFYSTNPYRKKSYTLFKQLNGNTSSHHPESNLNSVQHIDVYNEKSILNHMNYFPNATELTFKNGFSNTRIPLITNLNRIIPLKQLTKLVVDCHHFSFDKIIKLLYHAPNIHSLEFETIPFYKSDVTSIEENETFCFVSNTNNITNLTFNDKCTLEKLQLLLTLCSRVQNLTINTLLRDLEPITRFLLDSTNPNTHCLYSLCFSRSYHNALRKMDAFIQSEKLLDDYRLKVINLKLYLWW